MFVPHYGAVFVPTRSPAAVVRLKSQDRFSSFAGPPGERPLSLRGQLKDCVVVVGTLVAAAQGDVADRALGQHAQNVLHLRGAESGARSIEESEDGPGENQARKGE